MGLEVIGAGFGRAGTMSLKAALEELGFDPCYHMSEVFDNPEHIETWDAAATGKPVNWRHFLKDYRATVDWPGCSFYEELMREYPDAKALLSVRDPDRWYESVSNTIYNVRRISTGSRFTAEIFSVVGVFVPRMKRGARMVNNLIWEGTFDGRFENRRYAIGVFDRHNANVMRNVPEDRLLVYEVKEGWGPLCDFLDAEVPDKPFPHLNDSGGFRKMVRNQFTVALAPTALAMLAMLALLVLLFWLASRRRS
jgi:hypothetical protein